MTVLALAQVFVQLAPPARAVTPDWSVEPYRIAPDASPVKGASSSADGPLLRPGTYADTISAGERKFYRIGLDGSSHAYVSAVLAPPPGSEVAGTDGVRVNLESADGAQCSDGTDITFGGATARPVADYSTRRIGAGRECQEAGEYLYSVEWVGSSGGSRARDWPLELKFMTEPGLKDGESTPPAPSSWNSRAPEEELGQPKDVSGGSGFNDAFAVGTGEWRDRLDPGESRFYKVPVDWGQQLFLKAKFADGGGGGGSSESARTVTDGLRLTLFNTARGFVDSADADRAGEAVDASLGTAPVAFANRTSDEPAAGAMRFAGWYYIRVTVDRRVERSLPVSLRVAVEGDAQPRPAYDGDEFAAGFGVVGKDLNAVRAGLTGGDSDRKQTMRLIGYTGIGLGTALVLSLVLWTLLMRRRPIPPPAPGEPHAR
ncbi:hypothetical protein ACWEFL_11455 [Streptomyces sp. NPDC004838]